MGSLRFCACFFFTLGWTLQQILLERNGGMATGEVSKIPGDRNGWCCVFFLELDRFGT